jgi:hypothetical protein
MELIVHKAAPLGIYLAFSLALYVWHVGAALLGAFIADRTGFSDGGFDPAGDLKKMALCSLLALAPFFALFYVAQNAAVFILYILVFITALGFSYLGVNRGFLFIVQGAALAGMILFVPAAALLRLPGLFLLYLAVFAVLLGRRQGARKRARQALALERAKERSLRERLRRDPAFTTFCYQCLYYSPDINRCQLRLDGSEVRDIKVDQRSYCTSFRAAAGR